MLLERRQRTLYPLLVRVALEVREEDVGPGALAARAALYAGEVDPLLRERRERIPQHARTILDREHDAGLVLARPRRPTAPQHYETGRVGPGLLDVAGQNVKAVRLCGQDAPNGGCPLLPRGPPRCLRCRFDFLQARAGELSSQPRGGLRKRHRVGED